MPTEEIEAGMKRDQHGDRRRLAVQNHGVSVPRQRLTTLPAPIERNIVRTLARSTPEHRAARDRELMEPRLTYNPKGASTLPGSSI